MTDHHPDPSNPDIPPLTAGDVYLYSHGNGAIFVLYADQTSALVPLADAMAVAVGCHDAGRRVHVGTDDTPIARDALDRITAVVPVERFDAPKAPHVWPSGTTALMEAASVGADHLLDDLLARGVDVHERDDSGSTALHHAAGSGGLHAIDALVAAGADVDLVNERGMTPHMVAMASRQEDAAQHLVRHGADPAAGLVDDVAFGGWHGGVMWVWLVLPTAFLALMVAVLWPLGIVDVGVLVAIAFGYSLVIPPRPFWAGGRPRRLRGEVLTIASALGRERDIDLSRVTVAGAGGSTSKGSFMGARWMVLGHPDGVPIDRARTWRRLMIPPAEVEFLQARADAFVVVPLEGSKRDEVLLPVGNVLSGRAVSMAPALRQQVQWAREAAD